LGAASGGNSELSASANISVLFALQDRHSVAVSLVGDNQVVIAQVRAVIVQIGFSEESEAVVFAIIEKHLMRSESPARRVADFQTPCCYIDARPGTRGSLQQYLLP
jgi:hypothetical protein